MTLLSSDFKKILSSRTEQANSSSCKLFVEEFNQKKIKNQNEKEKKYIKYTNRKRKLTSWCVPQMWQLSVTFMATFSTSLKRQVINLLTHSNRLAGKAAHVSTI